MTGSVATTSPSSSAQRARQALGDRLRELRTDAGLTAKALAVGAGWERTKVSKIEHAVRAPNAEDVRVWCRLCGAEDQTDDLIASLRAVEGAYVEWRRVQRTGLRRLQESYVPLYERTRLMQVYCSQVIPGPLQTRDYARALLSAITAHHNTPDDVDEAVEARVARQRILREAGHRYVLVVEEAALRYRVGDIGVMAGQLRHLLDAMSLPAVALLVVPLTAQRTQWTLENFTIFDRAQVQVELLSARVNITAPGEVKMYVDALNQFVKMAIAGPGARALIHAAIDALD